MKDGTNERDAARTTRADMTPCYRAFDAVEAALVASRIEGAGIHVETHDQPAAMAFGDTPGTVLTVDVWVPAGELERALQLVREHLDETRAAREPDTSFRARWVCAACGRVNDAGFDLCWNCQAPRVGEGG